MNFKGSPSPWTITKKKQTHIDSIEDSWYSLAKVYTTVVGMGGEISENSLRGQYNALLISKAPELLQKLQFVLGMLDDMFEEYKGELPDSLEERVVPVMAQVEELIKETTELK